MLPYEQSSRSRLVGQLLYALTPRGLVPIRDARATLTYVNTSRSREGGLHSAHGVHA